MGKNVTIKDVALRAGVSKGTVDRVVHNRGVVSKESAQRVLEAIKELNYVPDRHAAMLATRTVRTIACLIPSSESGGYWDMINDGIQTAAAAIKEMNLRTEVFCFDMNDVHSFRDACHSLIASEPAAAVVAPLFLAESIPFVDQLANRGIPYVYIDTKIEESRSLAYFGMPKYDSGYLCASLLTFKIPAEELRKIVIVRVSRDRHGLSDPTVNRREGFCDYIYEHFPNCQIFNVFISPNATEDEIRDNLDRFFSENPDVRHVAMLSSRIHLIGNYLRTHMKDDLRVIGFDNLKSNIDLLKDGTVDILISQKIEEQSIRALRVMSDYLLLFKRPEKRDNYMHMDILTKLNIADY